MRHSDTLSRETDSRTPDLVGFPFSGSDKRGMPRRLDVAILVAVALIAGLAWAGASVGRPVHSDYRAGQSLKRLVFDGIRLVPVPEHPYMRGEASRDYSCFSDGLCFYEIDVFRRLYPAYNDLEDEVLLHEMRTRNARP